MRRTPRSVRGASWPLSRTALLVLIWGIVPVALSHAGEDEAAAHFRNGTTAYDAGHFGEAAKEFQGALEEGARDPRVYYNLSCALFRSGEVGRAVQNGEIAAALDPSDRDTRENLDYLSTQIVDRFGPSGDDWLTGAIDAMTARAGPNALAILFLCCESLSVLLVIAGVRQHRQLGSAGVVAPLAAGALCVTILAGAALGLVAWRREAVHEAVVLPEKAEALSGPGADHPALFAVHAGLKVRIRAEREGWVQVGIPSGLSGWLPAEDIGRIELP